MIENLMSYEKKFAVFPFCFCDEEMIEFLFEQLRVRFPGGPWNWPPEEIQ